MMDPSKLRRFLQLFSNAYFGKMSAQKHDFNLLKCVLLRSQSLRPEMYALTWLPPPLLRHCQHLAVFRLTYCLTVRYLV